MRLQKLSDAIAAIEKNLENLKETLEELEAKEYSMPLDVQLNIFNTILLAEGVDCIFDKNDEYSPCSMFQELLKDKEYGLKTILLLWDIHARENDILYRVFPWIEEATLEDAYKDSIFTIEDWLIENYNSEMVSSFLNKTLEKRR